MATGSPGGVGRGREGSVGPPEIRERSGEVGRAPEVWEGSGGPLEVR